MSATSTQADRSQIEMFAPDSLGLSPQEIARRIQREEEEAVRQLAASSRRTSTAYAVPDIDGEQLEALAEIEFFLGSDRQCFVLHGLAGTGKTTLLAALTKRYPYADLVAPTGKAAAVLARKTGVDASTIHSLLYGPPVEDEDGKLIFNQKRCDPGELRGRLVLLDEASMVNERLAADLMETGARIVASGDPGQLPPVQGNQYFSEPDFTLTEIRRQAFGSPIIRQAHYVRSGGDYHDDGDAFRVINRHEATSLIESGWPDIVLCWRNDTRQRINKFIRERCAGHPWFALPEPGEPVICLENHKAGIMNGEVFTVCDFHPDRGILLNDGPGVFLPDPWFEWKNPRQKMPRWSVSFALAYAATVHKAQGSEWPNVLILDEFTGTDRIRWLYTAITRASSAVAIVRGRGGVA